MATPTISSYPNYVRVWVRTGDTAATTVEKIEAAMGAVENGIGTNRQAREIQAAMLEQNRVSRGYGSSSLANYVNVGTMIDEAGRDLQESPKKGIVLGQAVYTAYTAAGADQTLVAADVAAGVDAIEILNRHKDGFYKKEAPAKKTLADAIVAALMSGSAAEFSETELARIAEAARQFDAAHAVLAPVSETVAA